VPHSGSGRGGGQRGAPIMSAAYVMPGICIMIVIISFLAVVGVITGWWLSHQRLMTKPWLEIDAFGDRPAWGGAPIPVAKVGLGVFLAVVGCLFALLVSAYFMRIDLSRPGAVATAGVAAAAPVLRAMPIPKLLWLNTAVLVVSSVALECAQIAGRRRQRDALQGALLIAAASTLVFLTGQLLVWRQLMDAGYFVAGDPANAFFYLLTGVHGLHIAGGLVALGKTTAKVWRGVPIERLRVSVWLCTVYWHFLLVVWLIIFAILTGWADDLIVICRSLVI
jgi:cytochrome c oxidase subunit 3